MGERDDQLRSDELCGRRRTAASRLAACSTVAGARADASSVGHDVSKGATAVKNAVTQ